MYFLQGGKCAIKTCENEAVCVDHCHSSNNVRKLLCEGCNTKLGSIESPIFPYLLEYLYEETFN